jgi:hypothetical protein
LNEINGARILLVHLKIHFKSLIYDGSTVTMNNSCVIENALTNGTECICIQGYYGEYCQLIISWFKPVSIVFYIMLTICMIFGLLWFGYRLKHKGFKKNLATIAILFGMAGNFIKIVCTWLPRRTVYGTSQTPSLTAAYLSVDYLSVTYHLIATSIIGGFWYISMHSKFNIKISPAIKVISGVGACFSFIALIPALYFILLHDAVMGIIIFILPIIYNTIFVLVVTIKLFLLKVADISKLNQERKNWIVKWLISLSFFWVLFIIAVIWVGDDMKEAPQFRIFQTLFYVLSHMGIAICLSGALDFKFAAILYPQKLITSISSTVSSTQ